MQFADLGLSPDTLRALEDVGYSEPTPIQSMAIPLVMEKRDVLGIAQTGTGKTASFTLPMIEILSSGRAKARMPRSLVLAPTRELASQVADNAALYSKYHKLTMALLIGGESMGDQQRLLDKGVDILIATPGRLIDLFERGAILLRDVKMLVIDEADRMLDMGFIPDVERIVSLLPKKRQTLFFSATMNKEISRLADAFLTNPEEIRVEPTQKAAQLVEQGLVTVPANDKREALRHLLRREPVTNAFIFCNRKRDVDILHRSLSKHGFDVIALHGDMPQYVRTERLEKFKNGEVSLLVCSDVAARGIDISDVSHVFNFDVPIHAEDYVHRIGRTGRAGRKGAAFTIATKADKKHLAAIETLLGAPIPRVHLEGLDDIDLEEEEAGSRSGKARSGKSVKTDRRSAARDRSDAVPKPEQQPTTTQDRPNGFRNGSRGRNGRWRDGPQSEVMDMPIDDDAIGFGGFTPAFILEAVVQPFSSADDDELTSDEGDAPAAEAPKKAGPARRRERSAKRSEKREPVANEDEQAASDFVERESSAGEDGLGSGETETSGSDKPPSSARRSRSTRSPRKSAKPAKSVEEATDAEGETPVKPKRKTAGPRKRTARKAESEKVKETPKPIGDPDGAPSESANAEAAQADNAAAPGDEPYATTTTGFPPAETAFDAPGQDSGDVSQPEVYSSESQETVEEPQRHEATEEPFHTDAHEPNDPEEAMPDGDAREND